MNVDHAQNPYIVDADLENIVAQLMRDFADWIYARLSDEYDYQTSNEQLDESITANEYTFDIDGNRRD